MTDDQLHLKQTPAEVLAQLSAIRLPRPSLDTPYTPAITPMQKLVAGYCEDILGFETVGIEDNFFELGGDSLQMTRVMSRIREKLGIELTFDDFFASETLASLAAMLEHRQIAMASRTDPLAIDPQTHRESSPSGN